VGQVANLPRELDLLLFHGRLATCPTLKNYGRTQIANDIAQTVKLMEITKVGMKNIIG
jgi:hypothetical protein